MNSKLFTPLVFLIILILNLISYFANAQQLDTLDQKNTSFMFYNPNGQLKYPKSARDAGIQGIVSYQIDMDSTCNIIQTRLIHGIGYGCDEEALKYIMDWQVYIKEKNNSICPYMTFKFPITFKLTQ